MLAVVIALILLTVAACRDTPADAPVAGEQRYPLTGVVLDGSAPLGQIDIAHDAVKGLMPAMAMPFDVRGNRPAVQTDDRIKATLVVTAEASWLEELIVSRQAGATGRTTPSSTGVVGTMVPDFHLRTQDDTPIRLHQFRGRVVLLTFIYTRCPLPDYCPRLMQHFNAVKRALEARPDVWSRVHLLSVTLDPEYDTPAVLRAYGRRFINGPTPFARWDLATGTATEIQAMAGFFGLRYRAEAGQISHSLSTALIGAEGRVVALLPSNVWEPDEAVRAIADETRRTRRD